MNPETATFTLSVVPRSPYDDSSQVAIRACISKEESGEPKGPRKVFTQEDPFVRICRTQVFDGSSLTDPLCVPIAQRIAKALAYLDMVYQSVWERFLEHPSAAVGLMMISDLVLSAMDGAAQLLEVRGMPVAQVVFLRMTTTAVISLGYLLYGDRPALHDLFHPSSRWVWLRALAATASTVAGYTALTYLPLSSYLSLHNLRPFFTAWLCAVFLGEKSTAVQITAAVISFMAALTVVQPFSHLAGTSSIWSTLLGTGLGLSTAVFGAINICILRKINSSVGWVPKLSAYGVAGVGAGILYMLCSESSFVMVYTLVDWILLAIVCLCGTLAQMTLTLALDRASGMHCALLSYAQILWAVVWQTVIRSNPPSLVQIVGMAVIITAGCWAVLGGSPKEVSVRVNAVDEAEVPLVEVSDTPMQEAHRVQHQLRSLDSDKIMLSSVSQV